MKLVDKILHEARLNEVGNTDYSFDIEDTEIDDHYSFDVGTVYNFYVDGIKYLINFSRDKDTYKFNRIFNTTGDWYIVSFRRDDGDYTQMVNNPRIVYLVLNTVLKAIYDFKKKTKISNFSMRPSTPKRAKIYMKYLDHFGMKYEWVEEDLCFTVK